MAIERILGTDTGKAAFEKADRNAVALGEQINSLAPIGVNIDDANTISKSGFYLFGPGTMNVPGIPGVLRHENWIDSSFAYQETVVYSNLQLVRYTRLKRDNIWSAWEKIVTNKQPDWITATLTNGWTGSFLYRRNQIGQLEVKFRLIAGTNASYTVVLILPAEYRIANNPNGIIFYDVPFINDVNANKGYFYFNNNSGALYVSPNTPISTGQVCTGVYIIPLG